MTLPMMGFAQSCADRSEFRMSSKVTPLDSLDWRDQIFAALKSADIRQIGYVPDAGHARLIELVHADPHIRAVSLTTEEEGIAHAALELMDVLVYRVEAEQDAAETVTAALDIAFNGSLATAVLLSQRLIGA